jgi:GNAT superfamily N-acetyltransferase
VNIREAQAADDTAIGELLVHAFEDTYRRKMPEIVYGERRRAELRDVAGKRKVAKVWVAEQDGHIVGTVAVWLPGAPGNEGWIPGAGCLRHLGVSEEARGTGASRLLMDTAETWAKAQGVPTMCLHVRRGVTGVARLYEGRGYVRDPKGDLDHLPEVFLEAFAKRL